MGGGEVGSQENSVRSRLRKINGPGSALTGALAQLAAACTLVWVIAIWSVDLGVGLDTEIALGAAGLLTSGVILRQQGQLRALAGTDALTGLYNHRSFYERLSTEFEAAQKSDTSLGLVSLDLDSFQAINDEHGHPYGDKLLDAVGAALRSIVRDVDTAARVGGEKFALILPGVGPEAAYAVAERARAAIAEIAVGGEDLNCSAGVAAYPLDAGDPQTLVQVSDSALYWAKRGGRRRTRRYDPGHSPGEWSDRQRAEIEELLSLRRPDRLRVPARRQHRQRSPHRL